MLKKVGNLGFEVLTATVKSTAFWNVTYFFLFDACSAHLQPEDGGSTSVNLYRVTRRCQQLRHHITSNDGTLT